MKIYLVNKDDYDNIRDFYSDLQLLTNRDYTDYNIEDNMLLNVMNDSVSRLIMEY